MNKKTNWITQKIPAKELQWGPTSDKPLKHEEAKKWCEEQGGRLPEPLELLQAFYDKVLGFKKVRYWATTDADFSALAWSVDFGNGYVSNDGKGNPYFVRCVRCIPG